MIMIKTLNCNRYGWFWPLLDDDGDGGSDSGLDKRLWLRQWSGWWTKIDASYHHGDDWYGHDSYDDGDDLNGSHNGDVDGDRDDGLDSSW